ncbi:hypothetical protein ACWEOE_25680 [Amycolatopsis sp. NPDC004368]
MSLRHHFGALGGAALLVLAGACGSPGAGSGTDSAQPSATSDVTTTGEPRTEDTGTESPRPSDGGNSLQLAGLPIGGSNDERGKDDCINVSLLNTPPDGVRVLVAEVHAGPGDQVSAGGKCDGNPACPAYTFSSRDTACSVALTWLKPGSGATLTMSGSLQCEREGCEGYRLEPNTIDLRNPLGESSSSTTSSESSSETTETTAESATSTTTSG